jgi:hypothetical protein
LRTQRPGLINEGENYVPWSNRYQYKLECYAEKFNK